MQITTVSTYKFLALGILKAIQLHVKAIKILMYLFIFPREYFIRCTINYSQRLLGEELEAENEFFIDWLFHNKANNVSMFQGNTFIL